MLNKLFKAIVDTANADNSFITLEGIESIMISNGFPGDLIEELIMAFKKRIDLEGEESFQMWFGNLHYQLPVEFQGEGVANKIYQKNREWMEEELTKLEKETGLCWHNQAEDLELLPEEARKAQLVLRHRLTEVYIDLENERNN